MDNIEKGITNQFRSLPHDGYYYEAMEEFTVEEIDKDAVEMVIICLTKIFMQNMTSFKYTVDQKQPREIPQTC